MYLRRLVLFIVLGFFAIDAFGQLIPWSAERPLEWGDFQGKKRPAKRRFDAVASTRIADKFDYCTLDSIHVSVSAVFNPYRSWKKYKRPSSYLLKHEQGHFDIAELYARKLRKEISAAERSPKHALHTKKWFTPVYYQQVSQMRRCQRRYDRQTRHSRRRDAQKRWEKKIATDLAALSNYAL